jgi:hypothetical protein
MNEVVVVRREGRGMMVVVVAGRVGVSRVWVCTGAIGDRRGSGGAGGGEEDDPLVLCRVVASWWLRGHSE